MLFRFSFFADEKHVTGLLIALTGKARELDVAPVINAKKKGNGITHKFDGDLPELFIAEARKQKLTEVNAKSAKDIVEYIGANPASYYHAIRKCLDNGTLKKVPSKRGNAYVKYLVQPMK